MNIATFEAPSGFDFVSVWIANSVTKNVDRKGIRELHAKIVNEGDSRIAFLCETFRELDRMNFILTEGCSYVMVPVVMNASVLIRFSQGKRNILGWHSNESQPDHLTPARMNSWSVVLFSHIRLMLSDSNRLLSIVQCIEVVRIYVNTF